MLYQHREKNTELLSLFDGFLDAFKNELLELWDFEVYTVIEFTPPIKKENSEESYIGISFDPENQDVILWLETPNGIYEDSPYSLVVDGGEMIDLFGDPSRLTFKLSSVTELKEKFK